MDNTRCASEFAFGENRNMAADNPNTTPGWTKCLPCSDYGSNCRGPSLGTLGDIASVRAFHKAIKKARKISLRAIAEVATTISENTVNEYFSNVVKDFKWTTVLAIDNALTAICGNRVGLPPLDHACPASSTEVRQQLAAADMKLAAAELRAAQSEADVVALQKKVTEIKGKYIAQMEQMQAMHKGDADWLKEDVRMWRRITFITLGTCLLLLALLLCYLFMPR